MSLSKYINAFYFAVAGIYSFFKTERNAKIHLLAAIVAVYGGFYFNIGLRDWLWISLAIALVFITEMINTAVEKICNRITTDSDAEIKTIKDIAAGFVLLASIFSLVVAGIIFIPFF